MKEAELKEQLIPERIPTHVAVIMDGNGRWAKMQGKDRVFGHKNGVKAVRNTAECAAEIGVSYLTLYAFSTENWNRPPEEVNALMELFVETIKAEIPTLMENNISLHSIGDLNALPEKCRKDLNDAKNETAGNNGLKMILAVSYSAKWDMLQAINQIASDARDNKIKNDQIDENSFRNYMTTAPFPDPELLIRTGGEQRISNFLLWELAYSELYFTTTHWPDFQKTDFLKAIQSFQQRERRFGKISEQIKW